MPDDRIVLLALETTCDETGAAVLEGPRPPAVGVPAIRSSVIASQFDLHERFGGVVPEIASRAHVRQILPVIDEALRRAGVTLDDLGAVAVATRPGLVGALVVGLTAAKALALALDLPLIAVDHLEGHLYACQLAHPDRARSIPVWGWSSRADIRVSTPVGARSTPRFWGGRPTTRPARRSTRSPACSAWAIPAARRSSGPRGAATPRPMRSRGRILHDDRLAFSFSGLKTAVLYALRGQDARTTGGPVPPGVVADVAASFQEAVVDVLVAKTRQALARTGMRRLGVGGGVAANARFRERIAAMADEAGVELFIPPLSLCTDNAAMAGIALAKLAAGQVADLDIDVTPGLVRPSR